MLARLNLVNRTTDGLPIERDLARFPHRQVHRSAYVGWNDDHPVERIVGERPLRNQLAVKRLGFARSSILTLPHFWGLPGGDLNGFGFV